MGRTRTLPPTGPPDTISDNLRTCPNAVGSSSASRNQSGQTYTSGDALTGSSGLPSSSKKRAHEDRSPSPPDDGQPGPSKEKRAKTHETEPLYFSCPFFKKAQRRYAECGGLRLRRIRDVKQHLRRSHRLLIHCPICGDAFDTVQQRDSHLRARSCEICDDLDIEGMTQDQESQLHGHSDRTLPEDDQWFVVWDVLFPHCERPPSPYLHPEIDGIRQYFKTEGPSILHDALVREGALSENFRASSSHTRAAFSQILAYLCQRYERFVVGRAEAGGGGSENVSTYMPVNSLVEAPASMDANGGHLQRRESFSPQLFDQEAFDESWLLGELDALASQKPATAD